MAIIVVCTLLVLTSVVCSSTDCPSGSEWDTATNSCTLCQVAYYRTAGVHDRCVRCSSQWKITRMRGATSEADCNMPIGSRDECPSGSEWVSSEEACVQCPQGTYRTKGVDYWCVACPGDQTTASEGSIAPQDCQDAIPDCGAGKYWNTSLAFCELCPLHMYSEATGSDICIQCPASHVTVTIGTNSVSGCIATPSVLELFNLESCPSGTEPIAEKNTCQICPSNRFRTSGLHAGCIQCPSNTLTLQDGAVSPEMCVRLESVYRVVERDTGVVCPLGTEWAHLPKEGCYPCPLGTYRQSTRYTLCTPCIDAASTPQPGAKLSALCGRQVLPEQAQDGVFRPDECLDGSEWSEEEEGCVLCNHGYYMTPQRRCTRCQGHTTFIKGALTSSECTQYGVAGEGQPFFSAEMCPAGSEWSSYSQSCYPCPRGFYRTGFAAHGDDAATLCQACPDRYTTITEGSTGSHHCNLPVEGPATLPVSFSGCPPGYGISDDGSVCSICPVGTYQPSYRFETCRACQVRDDGQPTLTAHQGSVSEQQCLERLFIHSISPTSTLQSVEKEIIIKLVTGSGNSVTNATIVTRVVIGQQNCLLNQRLPFNGEIRCLVPSSRHTGRNDVTVYVTDGRIMMSPGVFMYKPDPAITAFSRTRLFASGGLSITVQGENFQSVEHPQLTIRKKIQEGPGLFSSTVCTMINGTHMECQSPNLTTWFPPIILDQRSLSDPLVLAGYRWRNRRDSPDPPLWVNVGFTLSGLILYTNLGSVLPQYSVIQVHKDPVIDNIERDNNTLVLVDNTTVVLKGSYLDGGALATDYDITVDKHPCYIETLTWGEVTCYLLQTDAAEIGLGQPSRVLVSIGPLRFTPGFVMFMLRTTSTLLPNTPEPTITATTQISTANPSSPNTTQQNKITTTMSPTETTTWTRSTTPALGETERGTSAKKKPKPNILLPILLAVGVLLILILILVIFHIKKRQKRRRRKDSRGSNEGENLSGDDLMKSSSSSSSTETLGPHSDRALPPLPVDAVFGPDRRTDRGINQRALAFPPENLSIKIRDQTKKRESRPPESYVMPQSVHDSLPVGGYESM